jgi:hypothetical protein
MSDYVSHSKITDPNQYHYLYDNLPTDMDSLHHVVNNIFVHIWKMRKLNIGNDRKADYSTRTVEAVLKRVLAYDDAPLTDQRPRDKQFVGDCRHSAVLLCSMLRQQGIPARVRQGFCQYISSNTENYTHHVITEYWDENRWIIEDPDVIHHDIPREEFLFGVEAWQKYRAGSINLDKIYLTEELQGEWVVSLTMVRDVASLAKHEVTSSDMWGVVRPFYQMTDDEKLILDEVASTFAQDTTLQTVQGIYEKYPVLKASQPLVTWDLVAEDMIEVDISNELE